MRTNNLLRRGVWDNACVVQKIQYNKKGPKIAYDRLGDIIQKEKIAELKSKITLDNEY